MQYQTVKAVLSGSLCGSIWWPVGQLCGMPCHADLRDISKRLCGGRITFRDLLLQVLMSNGGDFQSARFTADTVVRVERRAVRPDGKGYTVHVWERAIGELPDCEDLVNAEAFSGDFMGECE